jgi:hypothetical protein
MTAEIATRLRKPKTAMVEFLKLYMVVILFDKIAAIVRRRSLA